MRKGPLKVSGLVASGKVKLPEPGNGQEGSSRPAESTDTPVTQPQRSLDKDVSAPGLGPAANQPSLDSTTADNLDVSLPDVTAPAASHDVQDEPLPALTSVAEAVRHAYPGAVKIPLALVDDSPYQPRKEYDPEKLDELAMTMNTAGQAEPIRVRKKGARFELISGHRRKRAALSLGWVEIPAFIEEKDDAKARSDTMLAAIGSHGLSDWEIAGLLKVAMDEGLASNQRQLAAWSGLNLSKVNGCLQMLQLPPSILSYLERRPSLFGYETSRVILSLVKEYPGHLADIERGVDRLVEGKAQNTLKGWVLQAIKGRPQADQDRSMITNAGRLIFTTKRDSDRAVVVNCKSMDVDMAEFEKKLQAWLEEQASSVAGGADPAAEEK